LPDTAVNDHQFAEAFQHHAAGRLAEAEHIYRAIVARNVRHAGSLHGLGLMAFQTGRPDIAERLIGEAIAVTPDNADYHSDLGLALAQLGKSAAAAAAQRRAAALAPGDARHHYNLGRILQTRGDLAEAAAAYRRAVALAPESAPAHGNLGLVLQRQGDLTGAADHLRQSIALMPNNPMAYCGLGNVLLDRGEAAAAAAQFETAITQAPTFMEAHSNLIFALNFLEGADTARQQAQRRVWNDTMAGVVPLPPRVATSGTKIRIGYVSSSFRHQAATYAFAPVILHHDRARFDVVCYSGTVAADDVTARLKSAATAWRVTSALDDDQLAAQIRADGIDILVDCVGHMQGHRLGVFARKPAPIQVTAWGEPTGTGLRTMDYLLADPVLVPPAERHLFAEAIADLPCFLGYWSPDILPPPGPLPAAANGYVTFASFNRAAKITAATVKLWAGVLRAVPASRLVLKYRVWGGGADNARITAAFADQGIDPARLTFIGETSRGDHFAAYQQADICLDPAPHGGGMTTLDALWMGLPVVTRAGRTPSSRLAAAVLSALDLGDWIAADDGGYIARAAALAGDLPALAATRAALRPRLEDSSVGDPVRYTRAVEVVYEGMVAQRTGAKDFKGGA
jgi:protein O-GlcNAc transferase